MSYSVLIIGERRVWWLFKRIGPLARINVLDGRVRVTASTTALAASLQNVVEDMITRQAVVVHEHVVREFGASKRHSANYAAVGPQHPDFLFGLARALKMRPAGELAGAMIDWTQTTLTDNPGNDSPS
ncbi:MAG: hypothetical protein B7X04_01170 [Parcubacteria group bacterium 21-54-25]|nr:MAG: hypothetical protein B7X04_01170 [Parcubacteria group bacterium 21-54-25]HQU07545.1 hypothetical protein [Candidatus Paceibacterota bacterium]